MKKGFLSSVAKVALVASISLSSVAANAYDNEKKAVIDKSRNAVRSGPMGENCVVTKWNGNYNECAGGDVKSYVEPERVYTPTTPVVLDNDNDGERKERKFIVFFDFDSSEVTSDAGSILNRLARTVSGTSNIDYDLVGHTDSSGSDAYNSNLSKRRANAIKQRLVKMGATASDISTSWKGEGEQLVETQDGVKQPQNRRVEIDVSFTE